MLNLVTKLVMSRCGTITGFEEKYDIIPRPTIESLENDFKNSYMGKRIMQVTGGQKD